MLADTSFNTITHEIIGAAIDVHRALGPGLLESTYRPCLMQELAERGLRFSAEHPVRVVYRGVSLDLTYRIDLVVENVVVVELKSVERLVSVHEAQVLTYMKPAGL